MGDDFLIMAASFIKNEKGKREIILGIMHGKIGGSVLSFLESMDKSVSDFEQLVNLGTQINISGVNGKIQISKDDLREHLGGNLFGELEKMATGGREFLQSLGYESKSRVAPAVLLGKDPATASVMVENYEVDNPGDPPLQGMKISTFGESQTEQA